MASNRHNEWRYVMNVCTETSQLTFATKGTHVATDKIVLTLKNTKNYDKQRNGIGIIKYE